ncbi:helix-turn-helix transcriptional regulator [Peptoniphilus sp. Marseille-Q6390]
MKNKVIDYLTIDEVCDAIGIKRNSKAQITRWIKDGRIAGAYKFSTNWAIPISWVKSECIARGVKYQLEENDNKQKQVKLKDYIPLIEVYKDDIKEYNRLQKQMIRNTYPDDYIKFGNAYGIRKEDIK